MVRWIFSSTMDLFFQCKKVAHFNGSLHTIL